MRAALVAWGQPEVIGPLGGGHRNPVLELRRGRDRLVARWSRRSPASLDWEIGLLSHLTRHGLRVPAAVRHLHKLTAHWPQRPGFASTQELRTTSQGGDVDLSAMPADAVAACRRAWAGLLLPLRPAERLMCPGRRR